MGRNVCFLALLAGAYASNPDESSFRVHLERDLHRRNGADNTWVENKVASYLAAHTVQRSNYYLFSVMKLPVDESVYVGLFGRWVRLPFRLGAQQ
jgi:hypothetical protein